MRRRIAHLYRRRGMVRCLCFHVRRYFGIDRDAGGHSVSSALVEVVGKSRNFWGLGVSILIDGNTRVICQGFTGKNGTFHSEQAGLGTGVMENTRGGFGALPPLERGRVGVGVYKISRFNWTA